MRWKASAGVRYIGAVAERGGARARDEVTSRDGVGGALLAVLVGTGVVVAAVGVRGEFPLSDDASYAYAVRGLCTTGTLHFLPWTAPSLVLQAAYGAALCRVAGFSFGVLRASTVVLGAAGVVGFLQLLRHLGLRGRPLAFATALFALNPLYVNLAFTFMTDVPFTALVVWSVYGYARGLAERRPLLLVWGAAGSAAALLVRQQGILVAIAAVLAICTVRAWSPAARARAAAAALVLPVAAFAGFHLWFLAGNGLPIGYGSRLGQLADVTLTSVVNCGFRGFVYLGLFLGPVVAASFAFAPRGERRLAVVWGIGLGALAVALFVRERALMFYLTNVLYDLGLGALTLRDTLFLGYDPPVHVGMALALPLTVVAVASAAWLGAAWTRTTIAVRAPDAVFLHLAAALFFAATLLQARYYLDRHLLPAIPLVLAAVLSTRPLAAVTRPAALFLLLMASYAVAGTHDYLAWNRARFAGLDALLADGVSPAAIDGGVEFNAWYLSPTLGTWPTDADARSGQAATKRSWWWVVDDRFVASFRPLPGYRVWRAIEFRRWLPPGRGTVLVLEREGAAP
jgi:hypothetical protein